jgi:hypothetical protein
MANAVDPFEGNGVVASGTSRAQAERNCGHALLAELGLRAAAPMGTFGLGSIREGKVRLPGTQIERAGEFFVAAEIHRRGEYAVTFADNMAGIDVIASDADHLRRVTIQVKARTSGTWHARVPGDAEKTLPVEDESAFWAFVDLSADAPG